MVNRTAERTEFLRDVLSDAMVGAAYWASVISWEGDTVVIQDEADDDAQRHTVTLDTIAKGINLLSDSDVNYSNSGYDKSPYGGTRARIGKFNRSNGRDSDADALDFDAMLQLGLFGEVVYG